MKVLVVNCGSSSLKYQLFDMDSKTCMARGNVERVGTAEAFIVHKPNGGDKVRRDVAAADHEQAMKYVFECLTDPKVGVISDLREISAIGHRVVHGGEKFAGSVLIDGAVMQALEECQDLAPLHNPPNIMGIEACRRLMPDLPMVGVFDTAFHQTMPSVPVRRGLRHVCEIRRKEVRFPRHVPSLRISACGRDSGAAGREAMYGHVPSGQRIKPCSCEARQVHRYQHGLHPS